MPCQSHVAKMQDRDALPDLRAFLRDQRVSAWMRDPVRDGLCKLAQAGKIPIRFE